MDCFNEFVNESWLQVFCLSQNRQFGESSHVVIDHENKEIFLECKIPDFKEYSRVLFEIQQMKRKKNDFDYMKKQFLIQKKHSLDLKR